MSLSLSDGHLLGLLAAAGVSASALTWVVVRSGAQALARWRTTVTERAGLNARELFLIVDPRQLFVAQLALMALAGLMVLLVSGSVWMALLGLAASATIPRWLHAVARQRRWRRFDQQLPDGLMLLAGALKAGVGLGSALQQMVARSEAPFGQEFGLVLREHRLGVSMDDALSNLGRRVPTESATLMVSALRIAGDTGGTLAETLERTSGTVRARLQVEGKIDALTAQGRLQAWVVGALPVILLAVLQRMEPKAMALLWTTAAGWVALFSIVVLLLLGICLIRRIVAIDV